MRISGGRARGIPLQLPPGDAVRPATDAMRQAVFSSLAAWIPDAVFLDLFAGSGAYGLEALSRGARGGTFVERDARTARCTSANLAAVAKSLGAGAPAARVVTADATTFTPTDIPDLVFVDPPYPIIAEVAPKLFARWREQLASKPDALVIFEMPGELELEPAGWKCVKRLGKGARQPTVAIFKASRDAPSPA